MVENLDIQRRYNNQYGANPAAFGMTSQVNANIPAMQSIDAKAINDAAADSYLGQRLTSFSDIDPLLQYGITIPTWIALNQAMEKYNRMCRGEYSQSIVSSFGKAGDKISNLLFNNSVSNGIGNLITRGKNLFNNTIYKNSAIVRAFDLTPSSPELTMAKHQMGGMLEILPGEAMNVMEEYLKPLKSGKDFDSLGATKAQIEKIESGLSKLVTEEERKIYLQTEEFKFLNKNATPQQIQAFKNLDASKKLEYLKELKLKSLGFKNYAEFVSIKSNARNNINRIMEILENNKNKISRISYSNKNFGSITKGELIGRKVQFSEIYNKLYAAMGGNHTTKLGKTLAKLSNYIIEGGTNRIAGGKGAAIIHAFFLAEVLIRANRQEGIDNKFKSFMERYAELIGFFIFMGPSIKLMHKIGGLQYSGMTKEQVEVYRRAVKEFNEQVMKAEWTKDIYKSKLKELRAKFRPKTHNPFVYLARKAADITTVGLEQVRPYTKHKVEKVDLTINKILESPVQYFKNIPKRLKDFARNPKYWMKQMAGYPVRFLLPMVIFVPFMNKYLVKGTNAIFGKPKEGALADEGKYEEEQEKLKSNPTQEVHYAQQSPNVEPVKQPTNIQANAQITHTGNPDKSNNSNSNSNSNASMNEEEARPVDIPQNRYIPSSDGVKIKNNDELDERVAKLLKRADNLEKEVMEKFS